MTERWRAARRTLRLSVGPSLRSNSRTWASRRISLSRVAQQYLSLNVELLARHKVKPSEQAREHCTKVFPRSPRGSSQNLPHAFVEVVSVFFLIHSGMGTSGSTIRFSHSVRVWENASARGSAQMLGPVTCAPLESRIQTVRCNAPFPSAYS